MGDSVPSGSYSSVCNVLRQWNIPLIPTYRVYRLYDINIAIATIVASCYHDTKLLYKKLESSLIDYLSLSLVNYTLGLIGYRGIARARSSALRTSTYVST